jgi:hypothetical protein
MEGQEINTKDFWKEAAGIEEETVEQPKVEEPKPTTPAASSEPVVVVPKELSDDELIGLLQKKGINLKSIEDLKPKPTPEEIAQAEQERKNKVLAFGLETNKIKKDDYDAYQKASANKINFLYEDFAKDLKNANPDITEEEIQNEWKEYTFSDLDESSIKKQRRQKELNELADLKLKSQYNSIFNLDNEYAKHEQKQNEDYSFKRKVEAALPVYQKDVDDVLDSFKTPSKFIIEDTQNAANNVEIELSYNDADLKELKDAFLSKDQLIKRIQNGYTVEAMKAEADMFLWNKHKGRHLSKAAKDYNSKQQEKYLHGRKGIIPNKELVIESDEQPATVTTQFWKDVLPENVPAQPSTPISKN